MTGLVGEEYAAVFARIPTLVVDGAGVVLGDSYGIWR
jgi:hypothetical protein